MHFYTIYSPTVLKWELQFSTLFDFSVAKQSFSGTSISSCWLCGFSPGTPVSSWDRFQHHHPTVNREWMDWHMDALCLTFPSHGRPSTHPVSNIMCLCVESLCVWFFWSFYFDFFFLANVSKRCHEACSQAFVCMCLEHVWYNITLVAHYFNKPRLVSRWQIICPGKQILWPLISQPPPSRRSLLCGI